MTRRRYVGLDPAHEDAEPIVLYLDDPDGPETFQEAAQAFHDSLVDLWRITGLPVAEKARDRLLDALDVWHDWWKPMDLSGPWTASWTPEETVAAYIARRLRETFAAIFDRPAPKLQGIQGMRPDLVVLDETMAFGDAGMVPALGPAIEDMARAANIRAKAQAYGIDPEDLEARADRDFPALPRTQGLQMALDDLLASRDFLGLDRMRDKLDRELGIDE